MFWNGVEIIGGRIIFTKFLTARRKPFGIVITGDRDQLEKRGI